MSIIEKRLGSICSLIVILLLCTASAAAAAPYPGWEHSGSVYITTTPDGANLPASASEENFPVLIRLHKDFFDFSQAKGHGEDIRFATSGGDPLPYEIDEWEPAKGAASAWARVPIIKGNDRQEIKLYWGKADAASESSGKGVFNESNGYLSVWHMNEPVKDEVGTLESKDTGTTASAGIIGPARHFAGGKGIFCGEKIANYPSGGSAHSTEAWFRAEKPNATIIGWGNEGGGRGSKVRMQFRSPPHVHIDSDFSDVNGQSTLPMGEWIHVVHTYGDGQGKIYINGRMDGSATPTLNIHTPARLWIGGWYNNYDFVGDIDEVRISKVARSADWVRLEYENQKPLQTLTGLVVRAGDAFSVSPAKVDVLEGKIATISAEAGGAQKIYWILKKAGEEKVVATDRLTYNFEAGRVSGDTSAILQFKAIYANGVKTLDIPITIKEAIPDPVFTLVAPATWDGRAKIEVIPKIANLKEMQAAGAGDVKCMWAISNIAVTREVVPDNFIETLRPTDSPKPVELIPEFKPGRLSLTRAQNSGKLTVTAMLDNGGTSVKQTVDIFVTEPKSDPWVASLPGKDERPEENQFYARDDKDEGTLHYNGTLDQTAESVFLNVYADGKIYKTENQNPTADKAYAFAVKLKPGLIQYKAEFGTETAGKKTVLNTINNLVCGDAYLVNGQSNAVATSWGDEPYPFTSPWIRTFGSMNGSPNEARLKLWADATARSPGDKSTIGYWEMELGRRLVEDQKIPICIINGAVGGTRIDQHQRNPADPEDVNTIYGRLLWRVRQARLDHGIRGVLWHQGENDQGADGPTGGFGYETYRQYFLDMAAGWKQDYPNIQHYYIFQIWPKSCAMGINGSDNRLREVQRCLPTAFSNMSIMSTLGIDPPGGCHYPPAGYAEFARLICPLIERDNYGKIFTTPITPPNLKRAYYADEAKDQIVMEFDQPVKWDNALASQFYLDGESGRVASGTTAGNEVTLRLTGTSTAQKLTYLDSKSWSQKTLLRGENGIAALTFCEAPILDKPPAR